MKISCKILIFITNITFSATAAVAATSAYASEALSYNAAVSLVTGNSIDLFLENQNLKKRSEYDFARADLNGDGIPEYVLRPKSCGVDIQACTHIILAENKGKIILLSEITGRKLMLAGTFSHGIQDFLAFQNDNNDYEYERYIWSPSQAKYILGKTH